MTLNCIVFLAHIVLVHDFHLSKLVINIDEEDSSIECTMLSFLDDLEYAVGKHSDRTLKFFADAPDESVLDSMLVSYIADKINLKAGDKSMKIVYLGKEMTNDFLSVYIYFEFPIAEPVSVIDMTTSWMTEIFSDQANLVQLKLNGEKLRSFHLDSKDQTLKWRF